MRNSETQHILTVAADPPASSPTEAYGIPPLALYGGVAVGVIFAVTYFTKISIEGLTNLLETLAKLIKPNDS